MRTLMAVATTAMLMAGSVSARAQTFPAASAYVPFRCGDSAMNDPVSDHSVAVRERDVVGTADAPAGLRASDRDFLYLRMRLDEDPRMGQALRAFAWGFAFGTPDDLGRYVALVAVDGATERVLIQRNTTVTAAGTPEDPADAPAVASYAFTTHGRVEQADSNLGGSRDSFVTVAVRWSDLANVGLLPTASSLVWVGSSTEADRLDGDLACHAAGGARVPSLAEASSRAERADPAPVAGGSDAGGVSFEGGPSCAFARGTQATPSFGFSLALLMAALRFRARRG